MLFSVLVKVVQKGQVKLDLTDQCRGEKALFLELNKDLAVLKVCH